MDLLQDVETNAPWEDTEIDAPWDFAETDADTEIDASWNVTQGDPPTDWAELSLVGRAERIFYCGKAPEIDAPSKPRIYPDGYVRRSPPQPYRVPEGYYRRIALRTALYAAAAVLLLLLLAALMKRGILRF